MADQISKTLVLLYLPENRSLPVVPGIFHLTHVHNTGAAFGLFRGGSVFLVCVTIVSVLVIFRYLLLKWDSIDLWRRWGWVLIVGGAAGNLRDRLSYRYVVDFLDFRIWPVFNFADSFVCVGVFLVLLGLFSKK